MGNNDNDDVKKNKSGGNPAPLSGSHKVKQKNHSRQKNHASHDM